MRDSRNLGEPVKFGQLVDRHRKRGTPVVPGSLQLVHEDADSILYTIVILKSQYEVSFHEL